MERSTRFSKNKFNVTHLIIDSFCLIAITLSFTSGHGVQAAVALSYPPAEARLGPNESYPESRFGADPESTEARERREQLDTSNQDEDRSGNRAPAGLEFSRDTGQIHANPVIVEEGTPRTLTNSNPKPQASALRQGVQEIAVIASDLGFFPKTLFATRDIPVRLFVTGTSKKPLCLMMDSFQVRKQVKSQHIEEISFTPSSVGQFRFYCPVNGMEGTLLVKELNTIVNPESQLAAEARIDARTRVPANYQEPPESPKERIRDSKDSREDP